MPAKDKVASATFFAEIFGLEVAVGHFAEVRINESLTFAFADHHYAFHVSDEEFDAIFGRLKAKGIPYGSGPFNHSDGGTYSRRGSRGDGHLLEIMTAANMRR